MGEHVMDIFHNLLKWLNNKLLTNRWKKYNILLWWMRILSARAGVSFDWCVVQVENLSNTVYSFMAGDDGTETWKSHALFETFLNPNSKDVSEEMKRLLAYQHQNKISKMGGTDVCWITRLDESTAWNQLELFNGDAAYSLTLKSHRCKCEILKALKLRMMSRRIINERSDWLSDRHERQDTEGS